MRRNINRISNELVSVISPSWITIESFYIVDSEFPIQNPPKIIASIHIKVIAIIEIAGPVGRVLGAIWIGVEIFLPNDLPWES